MKLLRLTTKLALEQWGYVLAQLRSYSPNRRSRQDWDDQYARGDWDRLTDLDELAHYGVVAGFCRHFAPAGSVLDVGCGEGLLRRILGDDGTSRYRGVDLSEEAIKKAAAKNIPNATFAQGDAATYEPEGRFDAIVFNEVLYYFEDPIGLMRRYLDFLEPGGVVILSMALGRRSSRIWKTLEKMPARADVVVANDSAAWVVKVMDRIDG